MSKLDDILSETSASISEGVVTGKWSKVNTKAQIKALFNELVETVRATNHPDKPFNEARLIELIE